MSDRYGPRSGGSGPRSGGSGPGDGGSYGRSSYGPRSYGPPGIGPVGSGHPDTVAPGPATTGRGYGRDFSGPVPGHGWGAPGDGRSGPASGRDRAPDPVYGGGVDGYDPVIRGHDAGGDATSEVDGARPSRRASTVVLVLTVLTSLLLFMAGFGALATVDLTSDQPIALPIALLTTFGVLCVPAFLLFLVATYLLVRRFRGAGLATAVSVLLPIVATVGGFYLGFAVLQVNAVDDLDSAGGLVLRLADLAENWGIPVAGPMRELGRAVQG